MSAVRSYRSSLQRSWDSLTREDRPSVFTMNGREWDLLDQVFAPPHTASTGVAMDLLGLSEARSRPWTGSMLEIGCGTGIIAVTAALAGCERVVASDVNPYAVRNAALNAARHGVTDRVRAVHSDLFAGLPADERFDTVYWHSNFVLAPQDYRYRSVHERAYVDPGYAAHRRYLAQAPDRLAEGGRALLHFSSRGDSTALRSLARETGRELRLLRSVTVPDAGDLVEHMLWEVSDGRTSGGVARGAVE
ncbi:methyltransferase domain-containing protein [Streptomyces sp. NPDC001339]|uniref:methyltransferase domain-containing protein n=1 Tax=Streptomyces sp. NPDC001339 TaxID=3364563 RepID=UPI003686A16C